MGYCKMLLLHPIIRLLSALLILIAIFLTSSIVELALVYTPVILLVLVSRVSLNHIRFIAYVTVPMLLALLLVWGWALGSRQVPIPHKSGVEYAFFLWLRIVSWGGVLQFLFVPLARQPFQLKGFLDHTGLSGLLGTLIIASIVFLPEMRRRMGQIIDARRAQGCSVRGLKGLKDLPTLLMPLISSLLDSAAKRAELWSHRGLLTPGRGPSLEVAYSVPLSGFVFVCALATCILVFLV